MSETVTEVPTEAPPEPAPEPAPPAEPALEPDVPLEEPAPEEPVQPEQHGPTEAELDKMSKQLERSATTWRNRVSEVLGEMAQALIPCELCDPNLPGFHYPPDMEQPRDQLHAALLEVLRNPASPEYGQAQHVRQCMNCGGWGKVKSGSRVPGKELVVCPTCKGNGFQGDAAVHPPAPAFPQTYNGEVEVEFPPDEAPLVTEDTDIWGSPRLLDDGQENPNYGKMPQYKNAGLP
jgi:hypothetical protein